MIPAAMRARRPRPIGRFRVWCLTLVAGPAMLAVGAAAHAAQQAAPLPSGAAAPAPVQPVSEGQRATLARTQELIEGYRKCGDVPPATACAALDNLFDFDALTRAPMVGHEQQLTSTQKRRFYAAFGSVVRAAARKSGSELAQGTPQVRALTGSRGQQKTDVHIERPEDDVDAHISFVWQKAARQNWRIIDVELDGSSMVQDYHNQFGRVLKKEGAAMLVHKVETRSQALNNKNS